MATAQHQAKTKESDSLRFDAQLAEYKALREEILFHMTSQRQSLQIALTVSGVLFGIGIANKNDFVVFLVPVLLLVLSLRWAHDAACVLRLGHYLRTKLEPQVDGLHWETHIAQLDKKRRSFDAGDLEQGHVFLLFGFVGTLSMVLAFSIHPIEASKPDWARIGFHLYGIGATVAAIVFARYRRF